MEEKCTCEEEYYEGDICPFAEDVHGEKTICMCCPYCREQCAQDI